MYNTNLAAEFFVLSTLYRLGLDATLTLGNKKAVDLVVTHRSGDFLTIDVKGLAGSTNWPVDNVKAPKHNHFLVFVTYLGRIDDPTAPPETYVVPSTRVKRLTYIAPGGRRVVPLGRMRKLGGRYRDAWNLLKRRSASLSRSRS